MKALWVYEQGFELYLHNLLYHNDQDYDQITST